jgi:hypothetical protein
MSNRILSPIADDNQRERLYEQSKSIVNKLTQRKEDKSISKLVFIYNE